jgi:hypothetical protein
MEVYIFDNNRKLSGVIEAYEYLHWTRRYSGCGHFELKAITTAKNLALLQIGNILWKNDDKEAGLIEFIELTGGEQEFIKISGRFATSFLARRIIWGTEILSGDLGTAVGQLLNNNLIAPTDSDRQIAGISYISTTLDAAVNTQISYKNLMDTIINLCDTADVGIKTVFDPSNGTFAVQLYQGNDTQAIFSKEYENIIDQVFTRSAADYANLALVGGKGEGADRTLVTTGSGSGENRYELFVDAKDIRTEDFPDNYTDALIFRGQQKLAEQTIIQAFDATVNQYGNLKYKTDFDIGSKIQAVSKHWSVSLSARITEIEESYDRDGMSLSVTFGRPLLTLAQKLKGGLI